MTSKKTLLQKYFTWYYLFNFEFTFESVDHRPECRDTAVTHTGPSYSPEPQI